MDFIDESLRLNIFWLRIMKEHALFIRQGLPCEETALIREAQQLEQLFSNLLMRAKGTPRVRRAVEALNAEVIEALDRIIAYKSGLLTRIITCRIGGSNLPLLIDHIRREAIRFRTVLIRLQNNITIRPTEELLQEEIFWLRIMGEHMRFIAHLLDPSERKLVDQTRQFAESTDELRLQARDLESMVAPRTFENWLLPAEQIAQPLPASLGNGLPSAFFIPRIGRFHSEVIAAVETIKEFKQTALQLIDNCTVLSIIPVLLADHVLREAQMALEDLSRLEQYF